MNRVGKAFLYIIYFALVIVLAGFITHSLTSNKTTPMPKPPAVQHKTVATPKPAPQTPTPSSPAAGSNSALANSGPGNVAAVFIGASLVGSVTYRQLLITRLKSRA
jgi:hypothetical protein